MMRPLPGCSSRASSNPCENDETDCTEAGHTGLFACDPPAAQTLLKLIDREPEAALRALRDPRAA
jgi:hypothetical protein